MSNATASSAMDNKFELSVKLAGALAEMKIWPGSSLRETLYLGRRASLWDVVATFLVLYRFPLLFAPESRAGWTRRLAYRLRPYRGLAARFRDFVRSAGNRSDAGCARWEKGSRTVVFVCFTASFYREVLRPVAESIARRHLVRVVVLHGGDLVGTPTDEAGVVFHSIWDHWNPDVADVHRNMREKLRTLWKELRGNRQIKRLTEGARSHVGDINVRNELYWLFWREFPRLSSQLAVAEHMLFQHRPALVVSADDADQRCRVYSLLAREAGIPTLLVQQGLSFEDYPEWRFLSHGTVAAMGESSRRDMMIQGMDADRIVVTGHPGFDSLASDEPDVQVQVRHEHGVSEHHRVVLFASQPSYVGAFDQPRKRTEMIQTLVRVVESLKDVTLLIKPHPGECRRELVSLVGNARHVVITDRSLSITPLIKACDVFVTFFSTTAVQALYAGKPVINIDIPGSGGRRFYQGSQATWVARSAEDLTSQLTDLLATDRLEHMKAREDAARRFLREKAYEPDGKATDRVVQLITGLLGSEAAS